MSRPLERARNVMNDGESVLNVACLIIAGGFFALAISNISRAGNFLTIDSLFFFTVCLLLSAVFVVSPALWLRDRGLLRNPFSLEGDEPVSAAHAPAVPIHFEGSVKLFLAVLGGLLALTLVEVFLAYIHIRLDVMLTILIGLSLVKAALIVMYFMHLRFERMTLVLSLIPALMICICLLFIFFPDSFRASRLRPEFNKTHAEATAPTSREGGH